MPEKEALQEQETPNQEENQEQAQPEDNQEEGKEEFDKDRALETIRRQRESEKNIKKQLQEAQKALLKFQEEEKKRKDAELSDLERAQTRVKELEAAVQEAQTMTQALRLRQEFGKSAARLKVAFADGQAEDDAFELADMENVEIDAKGNVTGLDDVLKTLQKTRPYLFVQADPTKGTPPRAQNKFSKNGDSEKGAPKIHL